MFYHYCVILIVFHQSVLLQTTLLPSTSSVEPTINVLDLSLKYGHPATSHDVITEDGYILELFNLPGDKKYPVLLMHGMTDTADTWLVRGNTSLAITLVNAGYDVWLGNCRGNRYARRHMYLDPDKDSPFWNFSFHEHGVYDLPAIIDTILNKTGSEKINAIGHSQGNTMFYVLGSTRPEYNAKVNLMIALAPVCYLHNIKAPLRSLFNLIPMLNEISKGMDINEVFGNTQTQDRLLKVLCSIPYYGYTICVENILFTLSGADPKEFNRDIFKIINSYFPSSTSRKNLNHFGQVYSRKKFANYDYGTVGNEAKYNTSKPPRYDLKKVRMRVALIVGLNDNMSPVKDINILRKQLPNVVNYTVSPRKTFNHMDYVWGENMGIYLFPFIFDLLKIYS